MLLLKEGKFLSTLLNLDTQVEFPHTLFRQGQGLITITCQIGQLVNIGGYLDRNSWRRKMESNDGQQCT